VCVVAIRFRLSRRVDPEQPVSGKAGSRRANDVTEQSETMREIR